MMRPGAVAAIVILATPAVADELAAARKTFEQGIKQEEAGDWSGALASFAKVAAIKSNHIVRFHIALCLEKTGRLVDALNEFSRAKVQAEKEGGTDAELTLTNATKHIEAIRARIPSLRVTRPSVTGASLTIDGAASLFDADLPLDPGEHSIEVRAPERKTFATKLMLIEGKPAALEPTLEPLSVSKAAPAPIAEDRPRDRTWSYVLGGLGAASLVAGGVFYSFRASTLAQLDDTCDANREQCDPNKRSLDERGRNYTIAANVLLGVGVLAASTAIALVVFEPSRKTSVSVAPSSITLRVVF
jgi:hypothetical protein